jgi:GxxExxY protein
MDASRPEALLSGRIIGAAMKVHSALGPGLLESAYEACLAYELRRRGLEVLTQVPVPIVYGDLRIELAYRMDLLVEGAVVVELKAVPRTLPIHQTQLLSYLRLTGHTLGLLINFQVARLKDGIQRVANGA